MCNERSEEWGMKGVKECVRSVSVCNESSVRSV